MHPMPSARHGSAAPPPPPQPRRPLTAREWAREAVLARRDGDLEAAIECARRAVRLAPLHHAYRELFTNLLYDKFDPQGAEQALAGVDLDLDLDEPAPAPEPAPRRGGSRGVPMMFDVGPEPAPEPAEHHGPARPRLRPRSASVPRRGAMRYANAMVGGLLALLAVVGIAAGATWLRGRTMSDRQMAAEPELPAAVREKLESATRQLGTSPAGAVQTLRTAREEFPEFGKRIDGMLADALGASARASLERGQQTAAIEALREATRLRPEDATLWFGLGEAFRERARVSRSQTDARKFLADAEQAYRRALERDGTLAAAHLGLGLVYQTRGETDKAREAIGLASALATPGSKDAREAARALEALRAAPATRTARSN